MGLDILPIGIKRTKELFMLNVLKKMSVLAICFSFIACAVTPETRPTPTVFSGESSYYTIINSEGRIMHVIVPPMRDFTTLGLIFVESSAVFNSDGNIIEGSTITFDMLMREAHRLGADDIINLKVDEIQKITVTEERRIVPTRERRDETWVTVDRETTVQIINKTVQYKANAIAIKYTSNIVPPAVANSTQDSSNSGLDIRNIDR